MALTSVFPNFAVSCLKLTVLNEGLGLHDIANARQYLSEENMSHHSNIRAYGILVVSCIHRCSTHLQVYSLLICNFE